MARLHEHVYNIVKRCEVSQLHDTMDSIDTHRVRGTTIRARIKYMTLGDKCTADFFKSVRHKHAQTIIFSLKNKHGRIFTTRKNLNNICHYFYEDLYKYRAISEEALVEVFEGLPTTFMDDMNVSITKRITEKELAAMAKGKAPDHDGIPVKFF